MKILFILASLLFVQQVVSADFSFNWKTAIPQSTRLTLAFSTSYWFAVTPDSVIAGTKAGGSTSWNTALHTCRNEYCGTQAIPFEDESILVVSTSMIGQNGGQVFGIDIHTGSIVWTKQFNSIVAIGAMGASVTVRSMSGPLTLFHVQDGAFDAIIQHFASRCDDALDSIAYYATDYDPTLDIFMEYCAGAAYAYHNASYIWSDESNMAMVLSKPVGSVITANNSQITAYGEFTGPSQAYDWSTNYAITYQDVHEPVVNPIDGNVLLPYQDSSFSLGLNYYSGLDGSKLWNFVWDNNNDADNTVLATPDGEYFISDGGSSSNLYAINAQTGQSSTHTDTNIKDYQLLSVDKSQVYIYGSDGNGFLGIVSYSYNF